MEAGTSKGVSTAGSCWGLTEVGGKVSWSGQPFPSSC